LGGVFRSAAPEDLVVRNALAAKRVEGFISEAAFRIEAIRKKERSSYFAQSFCEQFPGWDYLRRLNFVIQTSLPPRLRA
jgi:hypothetical protein